MRRLRHIYMLSSLLFVSLLFGVGQVIVAEASDIPVGFDANGQPYRGDPSAPVTIIEFSSFECPYCAQFHRETYPTISAEYVETGKVKFVFLDSPLYMPSPGAEAAACAGEQGAQAFWKMHDILMERQSDWRSLPDPFSVISGYAVELGLGTDAFDACLLADRTLAQIEADDQIAKQRGISGVPAFLINDTPLIGFVSADDFSAAIDQVLAVAAISDNDSSSDFADQVVALTNQARQAEGLPALTINPLLVQSAQGHAKAMTEGEFYAHDNPHTGSTPEKRITATGYAWQSLAENIAAGYQTPEEVVAGWLDSPSHRANMLSPDFEEIGVGYVLESDDEYPSAESPYQTYWVQNFGAATGNQTTPEGPTFAAGDIFAAVGEGKVRWYRGDGTLVKTLDSGLSAETTGMAFDTAGNLYVTNFGAGTVSKFDIYGNYVGEFGENYSGSPESIVFDAGGNIYVGAVDGDNDIRKFDPSGKLLEQYDVEIDDRGSDWIDLAEDQCTIYYTSEGKEIKRFDVCSNSQLPDFTSELHGPAYALRILPNGEVLVADDADIHRVDANGSIVQTYDVPGEDCWFALNRDPDGTSFWSGDTCSGNYYKFNIDSGEVLFGPVNACDTDLLQELLQLGACMNGLTVLGELTEAAPTPEVVAASPSPQPTLTPNIIPTKLITMKIDAEPLEADVKESIDVEITLTGDSEGCGVSVVEKPVDVMLVLDHSGSMDGTPLVEAKSAAEAFVREMNFDADRVGVVQFSSGSDLMHALSTDSQSVIAAIQSISEGGGTAIHAGLQEAFDELYAQTREDVTPVIVILSDGESNRGKAVRVADAAKAAGIRIISVGLGGVDEGAMQAIASVDDDGNPQYYAAPNPEDLENIYVSIAKNIREYGLASNLKLRTEIDPYDFQIVKNSLEPEGTIVGGETITWEADTLDDGGTVFAFQVRGRKAGDDLDITQLTEAAFLECEQTNRTITLQPGPQVTINDVIGPVDELERPSCAWWQLVPWWLLAPLLLLLLLLMFLFLMPWGRKLLAKLQNKPFLCKFLALLTTLYLLLLAALVARAIQGDLCKVDQLYFWKITQDGDVGVYKTELLAGSTDVDPVQELNRASGCVACHAGSSVSQVIAAIRDDQNGEILARNVDGKSIPIPLLNGSYVDWSPDGTRMAISLDDKDIYVLDVETGDLRPLPGASDPFVIETMPAWSPDGTTVAFVRAAQTEEGSSASIDVFSDIYTVPYTDEDSPEDVNTVPLPVVGASGEGFNYYPAYSPDGKWLAFTHHVDGKNTYADDAADIYLVPANGGERILLRSNSDFSDSRPSWSPDGKLLGFASNRVDEQFDIFATQIGESGQSLGLYSIPGAHEATEQEHHPVWISPPLDLPWWQRVIALWPWLIPLLVFLILGIILCRTPKYTLSGQVTNGLTNKPISGASIEVTSSEDASFAVSTDTAGNYRCKVPKGDQDLAVTARGYSGLRRSVKVIVDTVQDFQLYPLPGSVEVLPPPLPLPEWELPPIWQPDPALIIGLGGTGRQVLTHIKKNLLDAGAGKISDAVRLVLVDTSDYELLEGETEPVSFAGVSLHAQDIVEFGEDLGPVKDDILADPQAEPEIRTWFPAAEYQTRLAADELDLTRGTRQRRPPARAALVRDVRKGVTTDGVDVVLAIDSSSSMNSTFEEDGVPITKLEAAKQAASLFVDQANLATDRIAVVKFNDEARIVQPLSNDAGAIKAVIDTIEAQNGTELHLGLQAGRQALGNSPSSGPVPIILLLSDGQSSPDIAIDAAQKIKQAGARIITIGIGDASEALLRDLASVRQSEPEYYYAPSSQDLARLYIEIARHIGEGSLIWRLLHGNAHAALDDEQRLRVVIVGSLAGGFGSAVASDVAYLARRAGKAVGARGTSIEGYLATNGAFNRIAVRPEVQAVNTYATLRELERFQLAQGRQFRMIYSYQAKNDPVLTGMINWRLLDEVYFFDTPPDIEPANDAQAENYYQPSIGIFPAMADAVTLWLDKASQANALSDYRRDIQGSVTAEQYARGRAVVGSFGAFSYRLPMSDLINVLKARWARDLLYRLLMGDQTNDLKLDPQFNQEEQADAIEKHVHLLMIGRAGYQHPACPEVLQNFGNLIYAGLTADALERWFDRADYDPGDEGARYQAYLEGAQLAILNGRHASDAVTARGGKLGYALHFVEILDQLFDRAADQIEALPAETVNANKKNFNRLVSLIDAYHEATLQLKQSLRTQTKLLSFRFRSSPDELPHPGLYEALEGKEKEFERYLDELGNILVREYVYSDDLLSQWYKTYLSDPEFQAESLRRLHWQVDKDGVIRLALRTWQEEALLLTNRDASVREFVDELLRLAEYATRQIWENETLASVLAKTALHSERLEETAQRLFTGSTPLLTYQPQKADRLQPGLVLGCNHTVEQIDALGNLLGTWLPTKRQLVNLDITDPYTLQLVRMLDVIPVDAVETLNQAERDYRRSYGLLPGVTADLRSEPTAVFRAEHIALSLEQRLMPDLNQAPRLLRPVIVTALDSGGIARLYALALSAGWLRREGGDVLISLPSGTNISILRQTNERNRDPLHPLVLGFVRMAAQVSVSSKEIMAIRDAIGSADSNMIDSWRQWTTPNWNQHPKAADLIASGADGADLAVVVALVTRQELTKRISQRG